MNVGSRCRHKATWIPKLNLYLYVVLWYFPCRLSWINLIFLACHAKSPKHSSLTDSFLSFVWHGNSHARFHGEKYWCVIGILDWFFNGANTRATWHLEDSKYTNIKTFPCLSYCCIQAWNLVRVFTFTWVKRCHRDFWNTLYMAGPLRCAPVIHLMQY